MIHDFSTQLHSLRCKLGNRVATICSPYLLTILRVPYSSRFPLIRQKMAPIECTEMVPWIFFFVEIRTRKSEQRRTRTAPESSKTRFVYCALCRCSHLEPDLRHSLRVLAIHPRIARHLHIVIQKSWIAGSQWEEFEICATGGSSLMARPKTYRKPELVLDRITVVTARVDSKNNWQQNDAPLKEGCALHTYVGSLLDIRYVKEGIGNRSQTLRFHR